MALLRIRISAIVTSSLLFLCTLFMAGTPALAASDQCVACHSDLKSLIRLTWEVEKLKTGPSVSPETSGEG